ncbi:glutathionylspermidine synthase family protein [Paenirhodobacter ferrireducens]|nr:glutathionylspermidine synthase family protein [Sinirhodobacter ferrireducens]
MEIRHLQPRATWREIAEEAGFDFHTMYGEPYWNEARAYRFSLREIEAEIEDPVTELHALCLDAVGRILGSEELMARMGLPREHWDYVAQSWRDGDPTLYGRMDLAYDSTGPAKLLEYNADTPTSLFESTSFQWRWLEDQIGAGVLPDGADQFNGTWEALVARFAEIFPDDQTVWFTSVADNSEDYGTTETLAWAAKEAGINPVYLTLDKLGITPEGRFADAEGWPVRYLFKLYPWENLLREPFAEYLAGSGCTFLEPPWKALVSNKAILPMLWRFNPGHPNLLPAVFEDEPGDFPDGVVIKPLFSREGASLRILDGFGQEIAASDDRDYDAWPKIRQAYHPLPVFDGRRPVIGAWVVGERCTGMGLREDAGLITQNLSQFVPHYIEG